MADMDVFEFAAMIEESSIETRVIEYYNKNILESVCLTDFLSDGLSMVYSFFDPGKSKQSLGTYMILDHIALAVELEVPYLYLGYWVPGSSKMDYKVNFKGVEIFQNNSWQPLSDVEKSTLELHPLNTAPVSEQVSSLSLPDSIIT
jgi:arginine-tRNA-protein transferase